MTLTLTPLPPPAELGASSTVSLAWQPGGALLAHVHLYLPDYYSGNTAAAWKLWLYRTGDDDSPALRLGATVARSAGGRPATVLWHPSGRWLLAGFTPLDDEHAGDYATTMRTRVYAPNGDDTVWSPIGVDPGLWGPGRDGQLAFDTTGRWLATAAGYTGGHSGIAGFDPNTGATTLAAVFPDGRPAAAVAWHPTDTTLLARVDTSGDVMFFRRTGTALARTGGGVIGAHSTSIRWHPSGTWFVADVADTDTGGQVLAAYAWPGPNLLARLGDFTQVYQGFTFNPGGDLLAGGFVYTPNGHACGPGDTVGLVVATVTGQAVVSVAARPWLDSGQHAGGPAVAFHDAGGGVQYLAASMETLGQSGVDEWAFTPPGFVAYRLTPDAGSTLYMKMPDGTYRLVGTDDQPLSFRLPDGTVRTWPGSDLPLYMRQDDGTWATVIG